MDKICPQFFYVFTVNLGVTLNKFFSEVCGRRVKNVYGEKKLKAVFNFFVFCLLQNLCLPFLRISLQVNFYQIKFFNYFF